MPGTAGGAGATARLRRRAPVAVVTDSTASLPADVVERLGIVVVPLTVSIDGQWHTEGVDLDPAELAGALRSGAKVTTSQPSPEAFARAYARAVEHGAREIVSVHLSGELSGTVRAAELAGLGARVPVHIVDSRSAGMGLGHAALTAAEVVAGAGRRMPWQREEVSLGARAAQRAREVAASATVVFLVDSLDHLRRGGRLSATAAALGAVLGLRPLMGLSAGRIEVQEKVRTRRAARERLVQIGADAAARMTEPRVAVHHMGDPDAAEALATALAERAGLQVDAVCVTQISAVIGAHAGPGLLTVVVSDG